MPQSLENCFKVAHITSRQHFHAGLTTPLPASVVEC